MKSDSLSNYDVHVSTDTGIYNFTLMSIKELTLLEGRLSDDIILKNKVTNKPYMFY